MLRETGQTQKGGFLKNRWETGRRRSGFQRGETPKVGRKEDDVICVKIVKTINPYNMLIYTSGKLSSFLA